MWQGKAVCLIEEHRAWVERRAELLPVIHRRYAKLRACVEVWMHRHRGAMRAESAEATGTRECRADEGVTEGTSNREETLGQGPRSPPTQVDAALGRRAAGCRPRSVVQLAASGLGVPQHQRCTRHATEAKCTSTGRSRSHPEMRRKQSNTTRPTAGCAGGHDASRRQARAQTSAAR